MATHFILQPKNIDLMSPVQRSRLEYSPRVPPALRGGATRAQATLGPKTQSSSTLDTPVVTRALPLTSGNPLIEITEAKEAKESVQALRIGVVFCGRQTPGAHNVVTGILDFAKSGNANSKVYGFVGGTKGLFDQQHIEITEDVVALYRNQGGFEMIGRTADKIRSLEHFSKAKDACNALELDGLVLVGGNITNTDSAHLAEYFASEDVKTCVVGVPGTIDGGMKNQFVETSFGFDTACKVYSQLVGNMAIDGNSAKKYYYFIRLMGRAPSHIALECALQTHPNAVVLAEEVAALQKSLVDVVKELADVVAIRAELGKNFGTILVPEGLVTAIPEMNVLIDELNSVFTSGYNVNSVEQIPAHLTPWSSALFSFLPRFIQEQLVLEREAHGTVQLSQIETEKLLAYLVEEELKKRKAEGSYKGSFSPVCSFFGYQARAALPSNFDCDYAYTLGQTAVAIIDTSFRNRSDNKITGYMAVVTGLKHDVEKWTVGGVPLSAMLVPQRTSKGSVQLSIPFADIDLHGPAYRVLRRDHQRWITDDLYQNPGPIQFEGPNANLRCQTLVMEDNDYLGRLHQLQNVVVRLTEVCRAGCAGAVQKAALGTLLNLEAILNDLHGSQ